MARFEKGNPDGPGRPRGSRNAVNLLLDQIAVEGAEAMVKKMVEVAADGDKTAARLLLNRIWTAPRGRPVAIDLPEIETPADLLAAHAAVLSAIAAETITPQEAAALSAVLETHRRAFELLGPGRAEAPEKVQPAPPGAPESLLPEQASIAPSVGAAVCPLPETLQLLAVPQVKTDIALPSPRPPGTAPVSPQRPREVVPLHLRPTLLGAEPGYWTREEINRVHPDAVRAGQP